jgi:hypothetical protein
VRGGDRGDELRGPSSWERRSTSSGGMLAGPVLATERSAGQDLVVVVNVDATVRAVVPERVVDQVGDESLRQAVIARGLGRLERPAGDSSPAPNGSAIQGPTRACLRRPTAGTSAGSTSVTRPAGTERGGRSVETRRLRFISYMRLPRAGERHSLVRRRRSEATATLAVSRSSTAASSLVSGPRLFGPLASLYPSCSERPNGGERCLR